MVRVTEVRWHGRGGQGAKTAAILLGEAASEAGKYVQAFPEYGPERMGAPIVAFNRISEEPVTLHCHVRNPSIVVVLDATLIGKAGITEGVPEDGVYVVNSHLPPEEIRRRLGVRGGRVFVVDATRIALDTIGRAIPNTPMMGALIKATGLLDLDKFLEDTRHKIEQKFRGKPEVIEGNLAAVKRAYEEVRAE